MTGLDFTAEDMTRDNEIFYKIIVILGKRFLYQAFVQYPEVNEFGIRSYPCVWIN